MADPKTEGPPYKSAADVPKGKPTPTQEELNKIASGEQVTLAEDGTPADPNTLGLRGSVIGAPGPKEEKPAAHSGHETATHGTHATQQRK